MEENHVQQELSLIKNMIEKTRREASESGLFLIIIGMITLFAMCVIDVLARMRLEYLMLPVMLSLIVINGVASYFIIANERKREKVTTYARTVYLNIWAVCGISILMIAFLFPLSGVYSNELVPMLVSIIMGIAIYLTGVVFEDLRIRWCGIIWWAGAGILAYASPEMPKMYIFMALVLLGWVVPGVIMNYRYTRGKANGS